MLNENFLHEENARRLAILEPPWAKIDSVYPDYIQVQCPYCLGIHNHKDAKIGQHYSERCDWPNAIGYIIVNNKFLTAKEIEFYTKQEREYARLKEKAIAHRETLKTRGNTNGRSEGSESNHKESSV